jgi:alpha-tubulin suppressor-like RCC1 family protein
VYEPIFLETDVQVKDVQAGRDFSLLLTVAGDVLACGANQKGQLGLGDTQEGYTKPTKIPVLSNIIQIGCYEGSVALD